MRTAVGSVWWARAAVPRRLLSWTVHRVWRTVRRSVCSTTPGLPPAGRAEPSPARPQRAPCASTAIGASLPGAQCWGWPGSPRHTGRERGRPLAAAARTGRSLRRGQAGARCLERQGGRAARRPGVCADLRGRGMGRGRAWLAVTEGERALTWRWSSSGAARGGGALPGDRRGGGDRAPAGTGTGGAAPRVLPCSCASPRRCSPPGSACAAPAYERRLLHRRLDWHPPPFCLARHLLLHQPPVCTAAERPAVVY